MSDSRSPLEISKSLLEYDFKSEGTTQSWLINQIEKSGITKVNKEGVCFGFSNILAFFIITGKVGHFLKIIQAIHKKSQSDFAYKSKNESNTSDDEVIDNLEITTFFEMIELAQQTYKYPHLMEEKQREYRQVIMSL